MYWYKNIIFKNTCGYFKVSDMNDTLLQFLIFLNIIKILRV